MKVDIVLTFLSNGRVLTSSVYAANLDERGVEHILDEMGYKKQYIEDVLELLKKRGTLAERGERV